MESKIAKEIRMSRQPVAVYRSSRSPQGAMQFKPGVWGCVIAMLNAASKGKTASFSNEQVACKGGKAGLGLQPFELGMIEYFLSTGGRGSKPGERYKQTPELAKEYVQQLPNCVSPEYVVFRPLNEVEDEVPECVVFLVNADQLSGLLTLANYDQHTQDNVKLTFGSGCVQSILNGLSAAEREEKTCYIGLTDPSARKCVEKDLLSFTVPYRRYLEMEAAADECFFHTETRDRIAQRIESK